MPDLPMRDKLVAAVTARCGCSECQEGAEYAVDIVLAELASSGRLLPEGAEKEASEFELCWYPPSGEARHWGARHLDQARALVAQVSSVAVSAEIREKPYWSGPWSVVEPVAIPVPD